MKHKLALIPCQDSQVSSAVIMPPQISGHGAVHCDELMHVASMLSPSPSPLPDLPQVVSSLPVNHVSGDGQPPSPPPRPSGSHPVPCHVPDTSDGGEMSSHATAFDLELEDEYRAQRARLRANLRTNPRLKRVTLVPRENERQVSRRPLYVFKHTQKNPGAECSSSSSSSSCPRRQRHRASGWTDQNAVRAVSKRNRESAGDTHG